MLKAAITGNIASGKSEVEKFLLSEGFKVIDTDKINHEILKNDTDTIDEILSTFKTDDITGENGEISREKLGKIVFSDDKKLKTLENILHKKIKEKVNEFFEENKNEKIVFVAIPLLFETDMNKSFDKVIFVSADENTRLNRLIKRTGWAEEYARKRITSQQDEEEKIKKSDYVIYNNSDTESLFKQTEDIKNLLLSLY